MDFQIIALDIDGTLTDDRKKISSLTLETLIEAEKKGIRLVLASAHIFILGRNYFPPIFID